MYFFLFLMKEELHLLSALKNESKWSQMAASGLSKFERKKKTKKKDGLKSEVWCLSFKQTQKMIQQNIKVLPSWRGLKGSGERGTMRHTRLCRNGLSSGVVFFFGIASSWKKTQLKEVSHIYLIFFFFFFWCLLSRRGDEGKGNTAGGKRRTQREKLSITTSQIRAEALKVTPQRDKPSTKHIRLLFFLVFFLVTYIRVGQKVSAIPKEESEGWGSLTFQSAVPGN